MAHFFQNPDVLFRKRTQGNQRKDHGDPIVPLDGHCKHFLGNHLSRHRPVHVSLVGRRLPEMHQAAGSEGSTQLPFPQPRIKGPQGLRSEPHTTGGPEQHLVGIQNITGSGFRTRNLHQTQEHGVHKVFHVLRRDHGFVEDRRGLLHVQPLFQRPNHGVQRLRHLAELIPTRRIVPYGKIPAAYLHRRHPHGIQRDREPATQKPRKTHKTEGAQRDNEEQAMPQVLEILIEAGQGKEGDELPRRSGNEAFRHPKIAVVRRSVPNGGRSVEMVTFPDRVCGLQVPGKPSENVLDRVIISVFGLYVGKKQRGDKGFFGQKSPERIPSRDAQDQMGRRDLRVRPAVEGHRRKDAHGGSRR